MRAESLPRFESNPERQLILQNEHVMLWHYPKLNIVHHQMVKSPPSEAFRELLSRGADLVEEYRATKWLSDDRANTLLRPDDERWSAREWLPRVLKSGFKYWAIVVPETAIGKLNMRRLATHHQEQYGIICTIEANPVRAFDWLRAQ